MPLRTFVDRAGVEWQVWSVIPGARADERRSGYDRRSPDPVFGSPGAERRSGGDRRAVHAALSSALTGGWLVFECPTERRRLAPIPPGWDRCDVPSLERLRDRARLAPPVPPP
ncbi:MAG TPA: hypothetical protein VFQ39_16700, partial [Longimicrobium sp.]|nr:hypothetical protein [Longimicrobium sp.]